MTTQRYSSLRNHLVIRKNQLEAELDAMDHALTERFKDAPDELKNLIARSAYLMESAKKSIELAIDRIDRTPKIAE